MQSSPGRDAPTVEACRRSPASCYECRVSECSTTTSACDSHPRVAVFAAAVLYALVAAGCGDDVSFCTDPDGDPPSCENCGNGRDDDLDGEIDCDDSFCRDAAGCRDDLVAATVTTTLE
jgi:hypothetical protein